MTVPGAIKALEKLADASRDFLHRFGNPRSNVTVVLADPILRQQFAQRLFLIGHRARGSQPGFQFVKRKGDRGEGTQDGPGVQQMAFQFGKIRGDDLFGRQLQLLDQRLSRLRGQTAAIAEHRKDEGMDEIAQGDSRNNAGCRRLQRPGTGP